MSALARKIRRLKRRLDRKYTERVALEWGCVPKPGEFSKPLRKRLLAIMSGASPSDALPCFWYNPDKARVFERLQDPGREIFLYTAGLPSDVPQCADVWIDPDTGHMRQVMHTIYRSKQFEWQWAGLRVEGRLYLPEGAATDRDYHGADIRRALDTIRVAGLEWCRRNHIHISDATSRPFPDR